MMFDLSSESIEMVKACIDDSQIEIAYASNGGCDGCEGCLGCTGCATYGLYPDGWHD